MSDPPDLLEPSTEKSNSRVLNRQTNTQVQSEKAGKEVNTEIDVFLLPRMLFSDSKNNRRKWVNSVGDQKFHKGFLLQLLPPKIQSPRTCVSYFDKGPWAWLIEEKMKNVQRTRQEKQSSPPQRPRLQNQNPGNAKSKSTNQLVLQPRRGIEIRSRRSISYYGIWHKTIPLSPRLDRFTRIKSKCNEIAAS